jgi:hypothetical protein
LFAELGVRGFDGRFLFGGEIGIICRRRASCSGNLWKSA